MKNIVLIIVGLIYFATNTMASDYPQTDLEKEMEEMGSLVGGVGTVFRPG